MVLAHFGLLAPCLALGKITGLYRYPVKGLSGDALEKVQLAPGETFPDDRRFALLKTAASHAFDPQNPTWLHKENFLCAFTDPQLMAKYQASYLTKVATTDKEPDGYKNGKYLSLNERFTNEEVLGPLDISTTEGRQALANFFPYNRGYR